MQQVAYEFFVLFISFSHKLVIIVKSGILLVFIRILRFVRSHSTCRGCVYSLFLDTLASGRDWSSIERSFFSFILFLLFSSEFEDLS